MRIRNVAVPAISFAQHPRLVELLRGHYPDAKINTEGVPYYRSEEETIAYLDGYEAAIVSFEPINERVLQALPQLKVVSKLGVGLDRIDPAAMREHGVRLGWTPGVNKRSVAELALCMALAGLRHVVALNTAMRAGERPLQRIGRQLSGRVVGVHGCGEIGRELVRLLEPFGCDILACDIKAEVLDRLRPDCVLINTARGRIIDEQALKERLADGRIAAAGIDAFAVEPPADDELLNLPNLIATPHVGAGSVEARWQMGVTAIEGLTENFVPRPGQYPFEDR